MLVTVAPEILKEKKEASDNYLIWVIGIIYF